LAGPVRDATSGPDDGQELPDDRALLAAHVAGDPEAFGTLFRRHRDRLWAVALRTLGDPEEAADALQDGLVSAFRRADSYRGDAAVTTWLHRIVVNACLDRARRRKVRSALPLPDDPHENLEENRPSAEGTTGAGAREAVDPAEVALDRERRELVLRALDSLPIEQRAALVLVDMEGYSVEEAAAMLDCAPGTVKSRCSRGRARLGPVLERLGLHASGGRTREPGAAGSRPSTRHETGGEQT
jgi:RNA polymerase sigma-70 factor, ECF subfamily